MEAEGDVAGNLSALYDFMLRRISEANINNDVQAIDDAVDILRIIKEAWDAIPAELHEISSAGWLLASQIKGVLTHSFLSAVNNMTKRQRGEEFLT